MALTYCDGSSSEFKSTNNYKIDELVKMFEISPTDVANIQKWKQLKAEGSTDNDEFRALTEMLAGKIVTADAWNKLCDCMVNLQQMYVAKGLDEINDTVADYVENYAEGDINNKLGTIINNLLVTNATQIIISTTQPEVVNGALWIKPKTT